MKDYLVKAYGFGGTVRIYAATTKNLVEHARKIHDLWPTSAAALGRLLTASVIMGAMYGKDDELTIRIQADGPLEGMVATTDAKGHVRGYVGNPHVFLQYDDGKLNVGKAVGKGNIHVTKNLRVRDIFTSTSTIQTGEIGEDFAHYFTLSEQIPSAVALGVKVNPDNRVIFSGGYIIQIMPGCKDAVIETIEKRLKALPPVTTLLENGHTPEAMIETLTNNDQEWLQTMPLAYACDCSKETFERGLIALGEKELRTLKEEDGLIETVCHFCLTKYRFDAIAIENLIEQTKKD